MFITRMEKTKAAQFTNLTVANKQNEVGNLKNKKVCFVLKARMKKRKVLEKEVKPFPRLISLILTVNKQFFLKGKALNCSKKLQTLSVFFVISVTKREQTCFFLLAVN